MANYPKFEQKIKQRLIEPASKQTPLSGYGMITQYDPKTHSAQVLMSTKGSDGFGEVYNSVPCPVIMGANFTAPEPGRLCWLDFKDDNEGYPVITTYFNSNELYQTYDYTRQTASADTTPRYLYDM